jgi:hypothetical protein
MFVEKEIMTTDKMEYQLKRLINDYNLYLDITKVGVLEYLILDRSYKGFVNYVQGYVKGEKDIMRDIFFGFDNALLEDATLKLW